MDIDTNMQTRCLTRAQAFSILRGNAYRREMMRLNLKGCKRFYHRNKPQGFTVGSFDYPLVLATQVMSSLVQAEMCINNGEASLYELHMKFAHANLQEFNKVQQGVF